MNYNMEPARNFASLFHICKMDILNITEIMFSTDFRAQYNYLAFYRICQEDGPISEVNNLR